MTATRKAAIDLLKDNLAESLHPLLDSVLEIEQSYALRKKCFEEVMRMGFIDKTKLTAIAADTGYAHYTVTAMMSGAQYRARREAWKAANGLSPTDIDPARKGESE